MAFKITQADAKRLADATQELRTGRRKVEDAVREYNEASAQHAPGWKSP